MLFIGSCRAGVSAAGGNGYTDCGHDGGTQVAVLFALPVMYFVGANKVSHYSMSRSSGRDQATARGCAELDLRPRRWLEGFVTIARVAEGCRALQQSDVGARSALHAAANQLLA